MDFTIQLVQLSADVVNIRIIVTNRAGIALEIVMEILNRLSVKVP